jgi:hypothetical protein
MSQNLTSSPITKEEITDEVIEFWKSEIKKINPLAPDLSIDNLLEEYRKNPAEVDEILIKAIETMKTTTYEGDSVIDGKIDIVRPGTKLYDEYISLKQKEDDELRANESVISHTPDDEAVVCREVVTPSSV